MATIADQRLCCAGFLERCRSTALTNPEGVNKHGFMFVKAKGFAEPDFLYTMELPHLGCTDVPQRGAFQPVIGFDSADVARNLSGSVHKLETVCG